MIDATRLREQIAAAGISQSELARRVGITQGAVGAMLSGRSGGSKHLPSIARELGTTIAYLSGEIADPREGALPSPTPASVAEQMNAVMVPMYDLNLSMGAGTVIDDQPPIDSVPFKRDWLRERIAGRIDQVIMAQGRGDSMTPTISDGDPMLIDRGQTEVREADHIWAFVYGDVGMVKRLQPKPKGVFRVTSDNRHVRAFDARADDLHIIGRVVSILKWQ